MKKFMLAAAGVLGSIPGLAVIASGIGVPVGYKLLFGGIMEIFGTLSLLLLWVNRRKIKKLTPGKITKTCLILATSCFLLIAIYITIFHLCVVEHSRGNAYYPIWTSGKTADLVSRAGSRKSAIEKYGIDEVNQSIDEMPGIALVLTTITLLLFYQGIFTTLCIMFGLVGFYEKKLL